jgi:hypothetical protein
MNKVGTKAKMRKRCGVQHTKEIGTEVGTAANEQVRE